MLNPDPRVSLAQLSADGELIQRRGADEWLPDAADFMARLSRLVAQGLGFAHCEELCVRGRKAVLSVACASTKQMVAMSGPVESLGHVLRRAGLE